MAVYLLETPGRTDVVRARNGHVARDVAAMPEATVTRLDDPAGAPGVVWSSAEPAKPRQSRRFRSAAEPGVTESEEAADTE